MPIDRPPAPPPRSRRSVALISTLAILVLITILVVGLIGTVTRETESARGHLDRQMAMAVADWGRDAAVGALRGAIDPVDTLTNGQVTNFWTSQPGAIVVFKADGSTNSVVYLFSGAGPVGTVTNAASDQVDLNATSYTGFSPIGGSVTTPMPVGWVNVLQNSGAASGSDNPLIARYAWWIDDESSKVNLNTADGTVPKGTDGTVRGTASFGEGFPTEVSLAALGGTFASQASQIVSTAWQRGFHSEAEVMGAGVSAADYRQNKLNLTAFGRSPEMNLFGEPKMYLFPAYAAASAGNDGLSTPLAGSLVTNLMTGPYRSVVTTTINSTPPQGLPMTEVYPASSQLTNFIVAPGLFTPAPAGYTGFGYAAAYQPPLLGPGTYSQNSLPQFPFWSQYQGSMQDFTNSANFPLLLRFEQYLQNRNSRGQAVAWPDFYGNSGDFTKKYTKRQIDSIALQLVDLAARNVFPDEEAGMTHMSLGIGPLSGELVCGQSYGPKITQVLFGVDAVTETKAVNSTTYTFLALHFQVYVEWYFPTQYGPVSFTTYGGIYGFPPPSYLGVNPNYTAQPNCLNCYDMPVLTQASGGPGGPVAGISPLSAAGGVTNANDYWMSNMLRITEHGTSRDAGVDLFGNPDQALDPNQVRAATEHPYAMNFPTPTTTNYYGSNPNVGSWANPALAMQYIFPGTPTAFTPGTYVLSRNVHDGADYYTRTNVASIDIGGGLAIWSGGSFWGPRQPIDAVPLDSLYGPAILAPMVSSKTLQAVLPINVTNVTPGAPTQWVHLWVDDPLVNKFPGDWHIDNNNALRSKSTSAALTGAAVYTSPTWPGGTTNGADPALLWMPAQSVAVPKTQRFPSVGMLQYIRTGMMPDISVTNSLEASLHGTPWRGLDFGAGQTNAGGTRYPDWAMLDLFTVPATLQAAVAAGGTVPPRRLLTYGGSTAGRINPNGSILLPWGITRTAPLAAALQGMAVTGASLPATALGASDAATVASAIASYVQAHGPFRTAGEVANVPQVAAYATLGVQSRNDVVRQLAGLMTPRSSVFSVWVVGQSIKKRKGNTQYGLFESGDLVTGEVRMRYVVERYLDLGMDGVAGNLAHPGGDGVGSWQDIPDSSSAASYYHPYNPLYKYRVLYAEPASS